ncbi:LrgB family protein [Pseudooceanicola sp. CBS1P-1]|uniref:LrgB family protein n=1 Tax=Pseudooceanicola albus TaxID=2692189 RepID=A0A6L7G4V7_9RHOB|nr:MULTISPECIES: LrgB family protein [Pseudooceanicola]MBT9384745.1 LrgB family protein [Pseudooceanicola endophyticus]MXN18446.1 LrgB family protein [Pseudooceanicola albus]
MTTLTDIWSYLAQGPLLWLGLTLGIYILSDWVFMKSGRFPLCNPVLLSIIGLGILLVVTGTSYDTYFQGAQFVHFMLGPATVGLAVPLFANAQNIRKTALPMAVALLVGSTVAVTSALLVAEMLGIHGQVLISLAPKSATAPVAIGISERMGGLPTLTAALVLMTGIIGAIIAPQLLNVLGVRDWRARGFAVGVAAHGIGTARAFQAHERAGAFAGIGMGLNALLTSVLAPYVLHLMQ